MCVLHMNVDRFPSTKPRLDQRHCFVPDIVLTIILILLYIITITITIIIIIIIMIMIMVTIICGLSTSRIPGISQVMPSKSPKAPTYGKLENGARLCAHQPLSCKRLWSTGAEVHSLERRGCNGLPTRRFGAATGVVRAANLPPCTSLCL